MASCRLTLVSASPRRHVLLSQLGIPFDVCPTNVSEVWHGHSAESIVCENAVRKVKRSTNYGDRFRLLLGADTLISVDQQILGKPIGPNSAATMLALLSGRRHYVLTGICLSGPDAAESGAIDISSCAKSEVEFDKLSPKQIALYIRSGEWQGKAGAYALQGMAGEFASCVSGDKNTVIGLPVDLVYEYIRSSFGHISFR